MSIRPAFFSHVAYRTHQLRAMRDWYLAVFAGHIQFECPGVVFISYDDEHHRIALLDMDVLGSGPAPDRVPRGKPGVEHVSYNFGRLTTLMDKYVELRDAGIRPYWSLHHGFTISMYYADPDGNQMEFQTDVFATPAEANDFLAGPGFAQNPVGVEYDPEELLSKLRAGVPESDLLPRRVHLPVATTPLASSSWGM